MFEVTVNDVQFLKDYHWGATTTTTTTHTIAAAAVVADWK